MCINPSHSIDGKIEKGNPEKNIYLVFRKDIMPLTKLSGVFIIAQTKENEKRKLLKMNAYNATTHIPKNNCLQSIDFFAGNC